MPIPSVPHLISTDSLRLNRSVLFAVRDAGQFGDVLTNSVHLFVPLGMTGSYFYQRI